MKYILLLIALSLIISLNAKPIFVNSENLETTPEDVKSYILAYLNGFQIYQYFNSTVECTNNSTMFLEDIISGTENYISHKYFEGSLNISDALGQISPINKVCQQSGVQLMDAFHIYMSQFKGVADFVYKVSINAMSNVKLIQKDMKLIIGEVWGTKNYTMVSQLAGDITSLVFAFQDDEDVWTPRRGGLRYTEADPFAPDPVNHYVWVLFESLYKFGINSKVAEAGTIKDCQEGILNMIVLDVQAFNYWVQGEQEKAWLAITDSLTFSHQIVESCYNTYQQGKTTYGKVKEQIIDTGKYKQNILNNLFYVVSDTFASWSQIWYGDFIFLFSALGNIVYSVFVSGIN